MVLDSGRGQKSTAWLGLSGANSKIDGQLSDLQKSRTCVQNATTVDAFKACKVDIGDMQREEEKKKDESMSDKMKEEYDETKEKIDDAL